MILLYNVEIEVSDGFDELYFSFLIQHVLLCYFNFAFLGKSQYRHLRTWLASTNGNLSYNSKASKKRCRLNLTINASSLIFHIGNFFNKIKNIIAVYNNSVSPKYKVNPQWLNIIIMCLKIASREGGKRAHKNPSCANC